MSSIVRVGHLLCILHAFFSCAFLPSDQVRLAFPAGVLDLKDSPSSSPYHKFPLRMNELGVLLPFSLGLEDQVSPFYGRPFPPFSEMLLCVAVAGVS